MRLFLNGKVIEIIGDKDYYVFKNGECEKKSEFQIQLSKIQQRIKDYLML